jgi:hypothetical protein
VQQGLEFPRIGLFYRDGRDADGVTPEVLQACCYLAMLTLSGTALTPTPPPQSTGMTLTERELEVGPLAIREKYDPKQSVRGYLKIEFVDDLLIEFSTRGQTLRRA